MVMSLMCMKCMYANAFLDGLGNRTNVYIIRAISPVDSMQDRLNDIHSHALYTTVYRYTTSDNSAAASCYIPSLVGTTPSHVTSLCPLHNPLLSASH